MSRAFVNEDEVHDPEPRYNLPERDSPNFDSAAALALLEGARQGNTLSAERATGYVWGEPGLVANVTRILEEAEAESDERLIRLARRFLRKAGAAE